jgi:hypothetical protein
MRRLLWLALGAIGGILVYRYAMALKDRAAEQGVLLTAGDAVRGAREAAAAAGRGAGQLKRAVQRATGGTD